MSKMSNQTKYFYKYDSNKLLSKIEKNYTIMLGQVVDSMIIQTNFVYDDKCLLTQEIAQTDYEEKPSLIIYDYDQNDSLISKIFISPEQDTIFWEEFNYYPDGKKTVFYRHLRLQFDPNKDFEEVKRFDTTFYRNEFDYIGKLCVTQRQYDNKGSLIKTINFDRAGKKVLKEKHLLYYNDTDMIDRIKYYNYSKSAIKPDFFSLDFNKDTIESCTNEFVNGLLTSSIEMYNGNFFHKTFYDAGREISVILMDRHSNQKFVEVYSYYENGDLKEVKSYNEEITHTNNK
jgi:hypothetical protein